MKQYTRDEQFICMKCVPINADEYGTIHEETANGDDPDIPNIEEGNVDIWTSGSFPMKHK